MGTKREGPPTWNSALGRGAFGAAIFCLLLVVLFRRPVVPSAGLSALMLLIYIPLGYYIERFFFNRRQAAAKRRERDRGG
jgi:drug/metabolite transporter (DMT)-like permease